MGCQMDFEKYKMPKDSYPTSPIKPHRPLKGMDTAASARAYAEALEKYEAALPTFREKQAEYNKAAARLEDNFWKDAFVELGIKVDDPRLGIVKSKAWEHGHSDGLHSVFYWLSEFWEVAEWRA